MLLANLIDALCQTEKLQSANTPPVDIDLVPGQAMARGTRVRVVIVVPSFAKRDQRYQPIIR